MEVVLSMIVTDASSDICEMIGLNTQRHLEIYNKLKPRFEEFAAQEKNIKAQHSGGVDVKPDSQQLKQAIRSICESTDPHEQNVEVLQKVVNKIYAMCSRT